MRLEDLTPGSSLAGLEPSAVATVVAVVLIADGAVQVIYKTPDGTLKERMLGRADEGSIAVATLERPWAFDGSGEDFKLAVEAKRIDLAFLFDPMMAVHTSNVDPLPHQITAVYESMLPRQPLRYVLADDPGSGKTIMAGLYIRELFMRADARRVLVVAPGSLVEQWRDELFEKFGLDFRIFSRELELASPSGNPFEDHDHLIVRLDQMARNAELQDKLCAAAWDLVVFDEAHKLSAHFYGTKLEKTGRFEFAERLGAQTRHLLLMTATPHNGKEEDFQLFLSLLDSDRFYGKFRDGVHKVDTSDLMRRMVKEEMVRFDGTPLFPERRAYTVNYTLSDLEAALYEAVTRYVQTEMGKADQLTGARKGSVGFALTALQRRLASSPEAIYQSLKRRKERLETRLREEKLGIRGQQVLAETLADLPEDDDDLNAEEQENLEETLIDQATASRTIAELEQEIVILQGLEAQAKAVVVSGQDRKWEELSRILQNDPAMRDAGGHLRKLIVFSEHRDTLNYLHGKIAGVLGNPDAIVTIHGGTHRDERRRLQALFRSDPDVRILVATDAAGEGVNLQNANLMVNYDLPWNPNRLEQRFGRIHRIGQDQVCHLWNLVAKETREGAVWDRLFDKLKTENAALNGRVFDILGEVFEEVSLKALLLEAIRYGDQPEVRARLGQRVESAFDRDKLLAILDRNALAQETMSAERLFAVKEEMEKAEARRLQPYFVRSFFMKAFTALDGSIYPREAGRFEITYVPAIVRERDRRITGRNRRELAPVLKRYERVCFTKEAIRPLDKPGLPYAALLHPGHPLMLAVSDILLEQHGNLLRQGALLVDPADDGEEPHLLFMLTHEIKSGDGQVLSKRLQFVRVAPDGSASFAGWAPHSGPGTARAGRPAVAECAADGALDPCGPGTARAGAGRRDPGAGALPGSRRPAHRPCGQDAGRGARAAEQGDQLLVGPLAQAERRPGGRQRRAPEPGKRPPHRRRPRRPPGQPQEGIAGPAPRHLGHAGGVGGRAGRAGRIAAPAAGGSARRGRGHLRRGRRGPRTHRKAGHGRGAPGRGGPGLLRGGRLRPEVRLGHHVISADCGRQTAGHAAHRGQGAGAGGEHRHHQPQRDTLRAQPGRQIPAGDRAGGRC